MRDPVSVSRIGAFLVALTVPLGCGGDDLNRPRTESSLLADSAIVASMKTPKTTGRIIYEPPVDLSITNARATRTDLFKPVVKTGSPASTEQGSRKPRRPDTGSARRP